MIDILTVNPDDEVAIVYLAEVLKERFTVDQRRRFLADLDAWNACIPPEARKVFALHERHQRRGTCTPALVSTYLATVTELANTPEWAAVLRWRETILALRPATRKAA